MKQFVIGYLTSLINIYNNQPTIYLCREGVIRDLNDLLTAIEDYPDPELKDIIKGMAEVCL